MTDTRRHYINTISRDHVERGVAGGFTQADHGKPTRLARLALGDVLVFYSPRTELEGGEMLQAFTAIGRIADEAPYQARMTATFHPWRRKVDFVPSEAAPIRPLIERLGFIADKAHWGMPFRRGFFEIPESDMLVIAAAMKAKI